MPNREKVVGNRYGTLVITKELEDLFVSGRARRIVEAKCDCGSIRPYRLESIKNYKSCGCLTASLIRLQHGTHLQSKSRLYRIWQGMKNRCYYKKHIEHYLYGALGITVCDEWRYSFENFMNWATTNGYSENLTLDRKKSNKNYEPSNCRWATPKQQANNTKTNVRYLYKGERLTVSELSDKYSMGQDMIRQRIGRGWTVKEAIEIQKLQIGNPKSREIEHHIHLRKQNLQLPS